MFHSATSSKPGSRDDVHTQLNPTLVRCVSPVNSLDDIRRIIHRARREHRPVSIAGGRHAAGGQQFATDTELVDTRSLRRVLNFDGRRGMIEVETGMQWPELRAFLRRARNERVQAWTVAQKQTGTDRLSIGGALAANAHGRGLSLPPFISNVESIVLIDATGDLHTCSRQENPDLFKLAIGGYGLFGFVYSAKLRLAPLRKVRRVVRLLNVVELPAAFAERIRDGFLYGDFQFAIDPKTDDFLSACVIFNLHTPQTPEGMSRTAQTFRRLIDLALGHDGSFYLTYHRYASRDQVTACYPQFPEFLRLKLQYDPEELFQSDWYRHYKRMFA